MNRFASDDSTLILIIGRHRIARIDFQIRLPVIDDVRHVNDFFLSNVWVFADHLCLAGLVFRVDLLVFCGVRLAKLQPLRVRARWRYRRRMRSKTDVPEVARYLHLIVYHRDDFHPSSAFGTDADVNAECFAQHPCPKSILYFFRT